jgi:hypothetical protein
MRVTLLFSAAVVAIVVGAGVLLTIPFSSAADRTAIEASGVVAVVVQLFAFAILRAASAEKFLTGWVIGLALRFVTVIAFAVVGVKALGMPGPAALISLVTFFFISTLAEPKFLTL